MRPRVLRRRLVLVGLGGMVAAATITTGVARADEPLGCETVDWGFLGSQQRTICDTPRRPDGSWTRYRVVWTPAGYVPRSTYCGTYSCTSSGGYYRNETVQAKESYVVFDYNVVSGEPAWLPPGTDIIR